MTRKIKLALQTGRHLGWQWLAFRLYHSLLVRSGAMTRRTPPGAWEARPFASFLKDRALAEPQSYLAYRRRQAPTFFFQPSDRVSYMEALVEHDAQHAGPVAVAEALARGEFRYFEHLTAELGLPPDWHTNPFTGQRAPAERHWTQIDDFSHGDIKVIWEPSRFAFTYALVRAYWRTGNEHYPELFWQLVDSWRAANPPQQGPNWMCGQEISFRLMAWCFGLYGFLGSVATTADRIQRLGQMAATYGERISANIACAVHLRNNHGISEGMGLWTIGLLFPEFRQAEQWKARGRRVLEMLGRELIYDDGSFCQHSANYQRLMLHDYLWALRLGDLNAQPLSDELRHRVQRAGEFLYQLQDDATGRLPLCGPNDGALILPLSNCDYSDFRPVIQTTWLLTKGRRCYPQGAWDEEAMWLLGPATLTRPGEQPARHDLQARHGGYYTLRAPQGFAFIRCASTFQHRPTDADQLHVDLWWRGQNIACDAGTFSYNAPPPWEHSLAATAYHNTVLVDNADQMERASRFLWMPWLRGNVRSEARSQSRKLAYWEGEHDGYCRLRPSVVHRRAVVQLGDEHWVILDGLASHGTHHYRLQWLLADMPHIWDENTRRLILHTPQGPYQVQLALWQGTGSCSLVRADGASPRGWFSLYYACKEPALSLDITVGADTALLWTICGPEGFQVQVQRASLQVKAADWEATLHVQPPQGDQPLLQSVSVVGAWTDSLTIT